MNQRVLGSLQVALAALCWSFAGVFCKWIPWNSFTINGFRALFAAFILGFIRKGWRVKLTKGTCLGAFGVMSTSALFMTATKLTSSANAIVLQYAMPVFVIGFCWIFFKQRPTRNHVIATVCIMIGVILCSWEGMSNGNLVGDGLAILSAVTYSLVFFCSRIPGANAQDYSFFGNVLGIPFVLSAFFDPNISANPVHWLAVLAMAACLAGGYFFITLGMRNTSPITAALLANLEPILNPIWVFLFLGERPGALTILGAAIVLVTATVYAVLGNRSAHS